MANSDGFLRKSKKINRTRILPLRWIGNICGGFAGNHIIKALYLDEDNNWGFSYKYHSKMYLILNKPYQWWGTYYLLDIKAWNKNLTDSDSLES